jgi:bifunctional non-homologous end joining protein LigD
MNHQLAALNEGGWRRQRFRVQPEWIVPMLATPVAEPPTGAGWLFEPRLSGMRCLAFVRAGKALLRSRDRSALDLAYPHLGFALGLASRGEGIFDGMLSDGHLFLFDCLYHEGVDLTGLPLIDRKKVLRDVVWYDEPIRFTPFRTDGRPAMYRDARARGAQGIIAKRSDGRYRGGWSEEWLEAGF